MKSIDSNQLKQLPKVLSKHRIVLSWLVILGLFGFTLLQAQTITNAEPDPGHLSELRKENESLSININQDLRQQIESLLETPVDTDPSNLGTRDPFNP